MDHQHAPVLMIAVILLSFFNLGAWGAFYTYTPEQYLTAFGTTGVGLQLRGDESVELIED
ncbi:hypothetical protein [Aneurinibacillus terranovensis]|uniref:hypothetical protein n=1 Tax=Aneurinibacillus terranovensis TaxID=278991 RepID=UPI001B7FCEB6